MRNHPLARQPAVYILANGKNEHSISALPLILPERVWQHKNHVNIDGFTARYDVHDLVGMSFLRICLKQLPKKKRWKNGDVNGRLKLIEEQNPEWLDLSGVLFV